MPNKVVKTPYPLIDADPHAARVIRYMRPSDLAVWAGATAGFPGLLYLWGASPALSTIARGYKIGFVLQTSGIPLGSRSGLSFVSVVFLVLLADSSWRTRGQAVSSSLLDALKYC